MLVINFCEISIEIVFLVLFDFVLMKFRDRVNGERAKSMKHRCELEKSSRRIEAIKKNCEATEASVGDQSLGFRNFVDFEGRSGKLEEFQGSVTRLPHAACQIS